MADQKDDIIPINHQKSRSKVLKIAVEHLHKDDEWVAQLLKATFSDPSEEETAFQPPTSLAILLSRLEELQNFPDAQVRLMKLSGTLLDAPSTTDTRNVIDLTILRDRPSVADLTPSSQIAIDLIEHAVEAVNTADPQQDVSEESRRQNDWQLAETVTQHPPIESDADGKVTAADNLHEETLYDNGIVVPCDRVLVPYPDSLNGLPSNHEDRTAIDLARGADCATGAAEAVGSETPVPAAPLLEEVADEHSFHLVEVVEVSTPTLLRKRPGQDHDDGVETPSKRVKPNVETVACIAIEPSETEEGRAGETEQDAEAPRAKQQDGRPCIIVMNHEQLDGEGNGIPGAELRE